MELPREASADHGWSRTVNRERLFKNVHREVFRKMMRQIAEFTGTKILTWTMLSNHFHIVATIPLRVAIDDAELLRRYQVLYPKPTKYQRAKIEIVRAQLAENGPVGQALRKRLLALMYDISQFFKLLKQRFSVWYNRNHHRIGPLWCERFGSTLLEAGSTVREMCAYVDLNCVRAGIVKDPKDYLFCGYAEAVAGIELARNGIMTIGLAAEGDWTATQAEYRVLLFSIGAGRRKRGVIIPEEDYREVVEQRGELPLTARWSARVRHFTAGAVLGSQIFVEEHLAKYRKRHGSCPRTRPRTTPIDGIMSLKNPRCTVTG